MPGAMLPCWHIRKPQLSADGYRTCLTGFGLRDSRAQHAQTGENACSSSDSLTGSHMPASRPQAVPKLLQENARVIVTQWRFAPGAETGWHRHAHDYVVVVLTDGKLVAETKTGSVETPLRFGQAYARPVGVEHNIVNPVRRAFAF